MIDRDGADEITTDGLVDALRGRLSAELERGSTTLRLALAETRLAASSAALLLGVVLAVGVLALLIWLLLVALAAYGLWRLGLAPASALGVLLGVHVVAVLALLLLARRLARDLGFAHTRRALADIAPVAVPSGSAAGSSIEPGVNAAGTRERVSDTRSRVPLTTAVGAPPPPTGTAVRTRD